MAEKQEVTYWGLWLSAIAGIVTGVRHYIAENRYDFVVGTLVVLFLCDAFSGLIRVVKSTQKWNFWVSKEHSNFYVDFVAITTFTSTLWFNYEQVIPFVKSIAIAILTFLYFFPKFKE